MMPRQDEKLEIKENTRTINLWCELEQCFRSLSQVYLLPWRNGALWVGKKDLEQILMSQLCHLPLSELPVMCYSCVIKVVLMLSVSLVLVNHTHLSLQSLWRKCVFSLLHNLFHLWR